MIEPKPNMFADKFVKKSSSYLQIDCKHRIKSGKEDSGFKHCCSIPTMVNLISQSVPKSSKCNQKLSCTESKPRWNEGEGDRRVRKREDSFLSQPLLQKRYSSHVLSVTRNNFLYKSQKYSFGQRTAQLNPNAATSEFEGLCVSDVAVKSAKSTDSVSRRANDYRKYLRMDSGTSRKTDYPFSDAHIKRLNLQTNYPMGTLHGSDQEKVWFHAC